LPNLVADIDRAWQLVGTAPAAIDQAFQDARAVLRTRLEAQAQLQRTVIDRLAALRTLTMQAYGMTQSDLSAMLEKIELDMANDLATPEAPSLPKNLLADFSAQHQEFKFSLSAVAQVQQALQARQNLLQRWEEADPQAGLKEETLKQAWSALPPMPDDAAATQALQQRFESLLQRVAAARPVRALKAEAATNPVRVTNAGLAEAIEAFEKAMQEGAVRTAVDIDKQLRATEGVRLTQEQNAQLNKLRGELTHLQGWAKWGGNISREELLRAAEELPAKELAVTELAKKVGGLRDRWKSLDVSAGPASKDLWVRFDAACTLAYAPAAAHFKKLAEERQANLHKAEEIIVQVRQFALDSHCTGENAATADWKAIASFCAQTAQVWHRLGNIDRKDKKRVDHEFDQSMHAMKEALATQQQAEVALREKLIADMLALNPNERHTPEHVRALQERWQQRAKALPLERKHEQALWKKFRAACDAVFAKRKEAAAGADADRQQHLAQKESLCEKLEASLAEPAAIAAKILRETKDAWNAIGPVPRAQENQIEARLQAAVSALQHQLDAAKRIAAEKERSALLDKVRLCMALEQAVIDQAEVAPVGAPQWQALPNLANDIERTLRARFDKALQAIESKDGVYRTGLENNRAVLLKSLLRIEILNAVESPAEMSRERLQMQVEVLQSTLKAGVAHNKQDSLMELCKLAAAVDQATAQRIERLIGKLRV
ncbi:MAG TPA: DUF349 domain-containing protein, partial [Burkholderiaceae bacterium]|nr:DUF349 domain-containing protein [Burkholderiaceae bacterium]